MIKKIIKKIKFFYYLNDIINLFLANIKGFFLSKKKLTFIQIPRTSTTLINNLIKKNIFDKIDGFLRLFNFFQLFFGVI